MDDPGKDSLLDRANPLWTSLAAGLAKRHALADERYGLVKEQQAAVAGMRRYLVLAHQQLNSAAERSGARLPPLRPSFVSANDRSRQPE